MCKSTCEFGCKWKDVMCEQRESNGKSGLNGESGSKTVCGGMEENAIKG